MAHMSLRASLVLRASVLFTVWIWVVLIRNMVEATHDTWSFRLIHIALGVASLAFAVATWVITNQSRRFAKAVDRSRRPATGSLTSVSAAGAAGAIGRGIAARRRRARTADTVGSVVPEPNPPGVAEPPDGGVVGPGVESPPVAGLPLPLDTRD